MRALKKSGLGWAVTALAIAVLQAVPVAAEFVAPVVTFYTAQEAVKELLPADPVLTERDFQLSPSQRKRLERAKNWDTRETRFVMYHAKNKEKKITRTVIVFPEFTGKGILRVAVGLSNRGRVTEAILMEAPNALIPWLQPLLKTGYMESFTGKDYKLKLHESLDRQSFSPLTRTYARHLANAVKKSAQLFQVAFRSRAKSD